ncbi:MAG: Mur ligase, partial [Sphingobacteriia bacterium]|nr:Mur ligase [Sphingobacteriia bacterium]
MNSKNVYFIGIGGTAMGNIACMLSKNGYNVSGSDKKLYPPMSYVLEAHSIKAFENFSEQNLMQANPDLVVVGNVISRGNPEFEWLLETKKFPFTSLAAFIGENILRDRFNIVVSGTHGKTTTTSLVTHILQQCGLDAGYMIGGVPIGFDSGAHLGTAKPFVIEGDEYDSALFDKRSKFIHYAPNVLVINNIEFDHADIFFDIDDVKRAFYNAIKIVPRNGFVVVNGDDNNIADITKDVDWTSIIRVGIGLNNDFIIADRKISENGNEFTLSDRNFGQKIEINTPLFGEYN